MLGASCEENDTPCVAGECSAEIMADDDGRLPRRGTHATPMPAEEAPAPQ